MVNSAKSRKNLLKYKYNSINLFNTVKHKRVSYKTKVFELPDKSIRQLKKSEQKTVDKTKYKCVYKNKNGYYAWFNYHRRSYQTDYYDNPSDASEAYQKFKLKKSLKSIENILPIKVKLEKNEMIDIKRSKIPDYTKNRIYSQQDEKCILCIKNLGEFRVMDHIKPISLGGPDNITNYQALCGSCNHWKTYKFDKIIKEYLKITPDMTIEAIKHIQKDMYLQFNSPS